MEKGGTGAPGKMRMRGKGEGRNQLAGCPTTSSATPVVLTGHPLAKEQAARMPSPSISKVTEREQVPVLG